MNLIKQVYNAVSNWLNRNLMNPTHSIREIIPGWDDVRIQVTNARVLSKTLSE